MQVTFSVSVCNDSIFLVTQTKNLDSSLTLFFCSHHTHSHPIRKSYCFYFEIHRVRPLSTNSSTTNWFKSTTISLTVVSCVILGSSLRSRYSGTRSARDLLGDMSAKKKGKQVQLAGKTSEYDMSWHLGKESGKEVGLDKKSLWLECHWERVLTRFAPKEPLSLSFRTLSLRNGPSLVPLTCRESVILAWTWMQLWIQRCGSWDHHSAMLPTAGDVSGTFPWWSPSLYLIFLLLPSLPHILFSIQQPE